MKSAQAWLAGALLAMSGCSPSGPATPAASRAEATVTVTVGAVTSEPLDRTLPVVGTLFARDEALVAAEVEGKIEKTGAEFGDRVRAGQELALIDTDSYAALAHQAEARVAQANAAAQAAEHDLAREQALRRNGIASPAALDTALAADPNNAEALDALVKLSA